VNGAGIGFIEEVVAEPFEFLVIEVDDATVLIALTDNWDRGGSGSE